MRYGCLKETNGLSFHSTPAFVVPHKPNPCSVEQPPWRKTGQHHHVLRVWGYSPMQDGRRHHVPIEVDVMASAVAISKDLLFLNLVEEKLLHRKIFISNIKVNV